MLCNYLFFTCKPCWWTVLSFFIFCTIVAPYSVLAGKTALVIGNAAYQHAPLKNPVNDAEDLAATLKSLGFTVILKTDATLKQMKSAIYTFGNALGKDSVGLFYYAGHAMQINGRNYLLPIDCKIKSESDVEFEAVDAGRVLGKMEDAGNEVNMVILDACRNNPFARSFRSYDQGLARMDAPRGSLIAYATAPGTVALDGKGRNGVFTGYLLENIRKPGLPIEKVLKNVRISVLESTNNRQVPWTSSSLTGELVFNESNVRLESKNQPVLLIQKKKDITLGFAPQQLGLFGNYLAIGMGKGDYRLLYNLSSGLFENDKLDYYNFIDKPKRTWKEYSIHKASSGHSLSSIDIRHLGEKSATIKVAERFGHITQYAFTAQGSILIGTSNGFLLFYTRLGHLIEEMRYVEYEVKSTTIQGDTIATCYGDNSITLIKNFERDRRRAEVTIFQPK